jgi:hypothetical protein
MDALWEATASVASYTRCILRHNKIVYIFQVLCIFMLIFMACVL